MALFKQSLTSAIYCSWMQTYGFWSFSLTFLRVEEWTDTLTRWSFAILHGSWSLSSNVTCPANAFFWDDHFLLLAKRYISFCRSTKASPTGIWLSPSPNKVCRTHLGRDPNWVFHFETSRVINELAFGLLPPLFGLMKLSLMCTYWKKASAVTQTSKIPNRRVCTVS